MHRITLPTYFAPLNLTPGTYLADDQVCAGVMSNRRGVTLTHLPNPTSREPLDSSVSSLLMVRVGGIGDLLLMTPTIREIKTRFPEIKITVATMGSYAGTLAHNPCVAEVITLPLPESHLSEFDRVIWYEGIIESNPAAETTHAVDLYAGLAGVSVTERRLDYVVTDAELETAESRFPPTGKKRIGIQVDASSQARCYPREQMILVAEYLVKRGAEVFLFGAPGSVTGRMDGVVNLPNIPSAPDFRDSAAILYTCDCVICPDSAFLHLASALDVPCVALFAAFDPSTRVTGKRCYVFTGKGDCVGCSFHSCGYDQWPEGKPCMTAGQCIPLAEIPPERIGAKAMQLATNL